MATAHSVDEGRASMTPMANGAQRLLREVGMLALIVIGAYVALALATYSATDPGMSVAQRAGKIANKGGLVGAHIADVLYYAMGWSAWWWIALTVFALGGVWQRVAQRLPRTVQLASGYRAIGFVAVLVASCTLEAVRMHSWLGALPLGPGGMLGQGMGRFMLSVFGFSGATLLLLAMLATGLTLLFGVSWLTVCEVVGGWVEQAWAAVQRTKEAREDRAVGEVAATIREQKVEEIKKEIREHEPIKIEVAPVEIPKSTRVTKEKQGSLFAELADTPLPQIALLDNGPSSVERPTADTLEFTSRLIERKLLDFNVKVRVHSASPGPVITRYEIEPDTGVKGSQVANLARDLARALSVTAIRVVETIPGTSFMGLEIPNPKRETVRLAEIIGSQQYNDAASKITLVLGKDIAGRPAVADLAKTPHLLVAGTTGSGKSVAMNAMILSILYKATPADVRLIMIDPKMLELSVYEGIPHLLAPVVTDMKLAVNALNWCVAEMERRYKLMSALGVRNLAGYNSKLNDARARGQKIPHPFSLTPDAPEPLDNLPLIVVLIDELADLMMVTGKKVEEQIARIAQKARAAGIHLVLATQRPSVDVITGLIKANVPTRIAFQVSSKIDSRTILDQQGAESLLGMGDMLFMAPGTGVPSRMHGAFVSDSEVHRVVEYIKSRGGPDYVEGILDGPDLSDASAGPSEGGTGGDAESDPMYDQAVQVVLQNKKASISLVQRHLRIGYNRSARLLEAMEKAGLVSAPGPQGNREIIAPRSQDT